MWPDKLPDGWTMPEELPAGVRILAYQPEIAPSTGRAHWQFYIAMLKNQKLPAIMSALAIPKKKAWFVQECNGTEQQNLDYCSKLASRCVHQAGQGFSYIHSYRAPGATPVVLGRPQHPGKRNDLETAIATMEAGGIMAVAEQHRATYARYHKGLGALNEMLSKHRDRRIKPTAIVLYGETGTGKTRRAYEIAEKSGLPFYVKPSGSKWWNGYNGETVCIIDEIAGQVPLPELLMWLDRFVASPLDPPSRSDRTSRQLSVQRGEEGRREQTGGKQVDPDQQPPPGNVVW